MYTMDIEALAEKNAQLTLELEALSKCKESGFEQQDHVQNLEMELEKVSTERQEVQRNFQMELEKVSTERQELQWKLDALGQESAIYTDQKLQFETLQFQITGYQQSIEALQQQSLTAHEKNKELESMKLMLESSIQNSEQSHDLTGLNAQLEEHVKSNEYLALQIQQLQSKLDQNNSDHQCEVSALQETLSYKSDQLQLIESRFAEMECTLNII